MPPPAQPCLILFLLVLLIIPALHGFPSAISITNLTLPFAANATSLNQPPTLIHEIPNTNPPLILQIEPLPHSTHLDLSLISNALYGAIHYQRHLMIVHHLSRSTIYPGRFDYGNTVAFTLQACDMGADPGPNPWQVGDLLDVLAGVVQVAHEIDQESGITVFRVAGTGLEEVAAGALYKDQPREVGGVMAASRGVGEGRCTFGGDAPQLTG